MSEISQGIADANTAADNAITRVQATVADLTQQIADLTPKAVTQEDKDAIAVLQAKLDALDPTNPSTLKKGHGGKR